MLTHYPFNKILSVTNFDGKNSNLAKIINWSLLNSLESYMLY